MSSLLRLALRATAVHSLLAALPPAFAQCDHWQAGFGVPGSDGFVGPLHGFRDASGPSLFVGGSFSTVDGVATGRSARWDGASWTALPTAVNEVATSFSTFDDGAGAAVYATLQTRNSVRVARWTGAGWVDITSPVGVTANGYAILYGTLDDGSGPALYLGGAFQVVNGVSAPQLARWNGTTWQGFGVGPGSDNGVPFVFNAGAGPALHFVARATNGVFQRWNGVAWLPALPTLPGQVADVEVFDDGTGPALYACGYLAIGPPSTNTAVARLSGSTWTGLIAPHTFAVDLRAHDFGAGAVLCAGITDYSATSFTSSTSVQAWNGAIWSPIGGGMHPDDGRSRVTQLTSLDLGAGAQLIAGGSFDSAGDAGAFNLARWNGNAWASLGTQDGVGAEIRAFTVHDDGSGPALYAGGSFQAAGTVAAPGVARWSAATSSWSAVGASSFTPVDVRALAVFDDGSGFALYAGGHGSLQRWNGSAWSIVSGPASVTIDALAVADLGAGPRLCAGGDFVSIGGVPASGVAAFDGASWTPLGAGFASGAPALGVHDDGSGPALYAAERHPSRVHRWNGTSWTLVGNGFDGPIYVLATHDDGHGEALYAGGQFDFVFGSNAIWNVARWRGGAWSAVGSGLGYSNGHHVDALLSHDDGNGPALYACGNFTVTAGSSVPMRRAAKWNGTVWTEIGGGIEPNAFGVGENVRALASFLDAATGAPALFAGGDFARAGGIVSNGFAEWIACFPVGSTFCAGDGTGTACPCTNGGLGRGCRNSLNVSGALLSSSGVARLSADAVTLTLSGATNQLALFLQGSERDNAGLGTLVFDGVRCVGGTIVRLSAKLASSGMATYPAAGELPISVRGHVPADGATRYYQAFFRDPLAVWCPPATANWSNGVALSWVP